MPQKYNPETAPSAEPDYVEQVRQGVVEHAAKEDARSLLDSWLKKEGAKINMFINAKNSRM